jgi:hypothetical protein
LEKLNAQFQSSEHRVQAFSDFLEFRITKCFTVDVLRGRGLELGGTELQSDNNKEFIMLDSDLIFYSLTLKIMPQFLTTEPSI